MSLVVLGQSCPNLRMAKIDLNIPTLVNNFIDLRDSIPGDSYNWSWVRPLSQVNYLAIHHSAGPDTQTPDEIANYHINNNGWGGIGYHFLIGKDGIVYYVGDISTARANVANLNEQVIGICLIGNFTSARIPTNEQFDSAHKLCDFFINNYSPLTNVNSWDTVKGHKELPGQSTVCPGDNWPAWRENIIKDGGIAPPPTPTPIPAPPTTDKDVQISDLKSQVDSLQTSLASLNQQVVYLQEAIQEKDAENNDLRQKLAIPTQVDVPIDHTLTLVGALINLYKFVFPPGKES